MRIDLVIFQFKAFNLLILAIVNIVNLSFNRQLYVYGYKRFNIHIGKY